MNNVVQFDAARRRMPRLERLAKNPEALIPLTIDGDVTLFTLLKALKRVGLTIRLAAGCKGYIITKV